MQKYLFQKPLRGARIIFIIYFWRARCASRINIIISFSLVREKIFAHGLIFWKKKKLKNRHDEIIPQPATHISPSYPKPTRTPKTTHERHRQPREAVSTRRGRAAMYSGRKCKGPRNQSRKPRGGATTSSRNPGIIIVAGTGTRKH